jgi:pyridoxamine 5'-phosphate oxidase-like protein
MTVARRIVDANMYLTIATADADGRPWVSPVWYAPATDSDFLWVTSGRPAMLRECLASVAIVIFDSTVPVGAAEAVYLEAVAASLSNAEVEQAIDVYSRRSQACGARAWKPADVTPPAAFRLYRATASSQFVLGPYDERLPVMLVATADRALVPFCSSRDADAFPLRPFHTATVTRRKVAGIEVASSLGLVFWLLKRASSSACRSSSRPLAAAASNAFMVGP